MAIRVTIWNEFIHERNDAGSKAVYPDGMHAVIKDFLEKEPDIQVTNICNLDMPDHGLTDEVLDNTDVLTWWGHGDHSAVKDEIVNKVHRRILGGMGFIPFHSSHMSKIFRKLMGTSGRLHWGDEQKEVMWNILPTHPIAKDIPEYFIIDKEEIYGEPFDIPTPDELVFISWFEQGNVFRSGCTYRRGRGKIFYFQPGHETAPSFYHPVVQKVTVNAVRWVNPDFKKPQKEDYMPKDFLNK